MRNYLICIFFLTFGCLMLVPGYVSSGVLDRVVAVVNDEVILLSELRHEISARKKTGSEVKAAEVLDDMIDRLLLLEEARKFMFNNAATDIDSLINLYVDRRIRAMIHIPFEDLERYYTDNRELFGTKEFYEVKDEIESLMLENELNARILKHTEKLRSKSYIRLQLDDSD